MNILVIVAHPDDEVLGCGATIAKHAEKGDNVDILIITKGITARYAEDEFNNPKVIEEIRLMNENALQVCKILGTNSVEIAGKDSCRLDKLPLIDITRIIEKKIQTCKPEIIYTHASCDANNDHSLVFKAVQIATRPFPGFCVKKVLLMEILSSTEWNFLENFRPNVYIDVSKTIDKKIQAMRCYETEIREFPHPRSEETIKNLAKKRGSEVGLYCAEAFTLLRSIKK
tara:strand:- start:2984 stop:3667 length:684 start_codon:yes stop_codon:yes gene_type:complete